MSDLKFWCMAEACIRGLRNAGEVPPLSGHILRRCGAGAIVLVDYIGQDADGTDIFGAVGYEVWE